MRHQYPYPDPTESDTPQPPTRNPLPLGNLNRLEHWNNPDEGDQNYEQEYCDSQHVGGYSSNWYLQNRQTRASAFTVSAHAGHFLLSEGSNSDGDDCSLAEPAETANEPRTPVIRASIS